MCFLAGAAHKGAGRPAGSESNAEEVRATLMPSYSIQRSNPFFLPCSVYHSDSPPRLPHFTTFCLLYGFQFVLTMMISIILCFFGGPLFCFFTPTGKSRRNRNFSGRCGTWNSAVPSFLTSFANPKCLCGRNLRSAGMKRNGAACACDRCRSCRCSPFVPTWTPPCQHVHLPFLRSLPRLCCFVSVVVWVAALFPLDRLHMKLKSKPKPADEP